MTLVKILLTMASFTGLETQGFLSQLNGTWQGTYCGTSTTTFRINTRTPQRAWVTEHWCNGFSCGDIDFSVTEIDAANRAFTVRMLQGTGFSNSSYEIHFKLSDDGRSLRGQYRGHPRCTDSQMTKVSSDPGNGPYFTASVTPLPSTAAPTVRRSRIPDDIPRRAMADDSGSTACLTIGSRVDRARLVNGYGQTVGSRETGLTRWIYNRCTRAVGYSIPVADGKTAHRTVPGGETHLWSCTYMTAVNLIGVEYTTIAYCLQ